MRFKLFVWTFCTMSTLANTGLAGTAANPIGLNGKSQTPVASASVAGADAGTLAIPDASAATIKLPEDGTLGIEIVRGSIYENERALRAKVKVLFEKKDFSGLDALADNLLSTKKIYWNGIWEIQSFMQELEAVGTGEGSNKDFENYIDVLNGWIKKSPKSATPRAALLGAWTSYAWKARGGGYSDSVTDEGWKQFGERLKKGDGVMAAAKDMHAPTLYAAEETLGLGESWDKKQFNKVFDEGVKYNPDYFDIYFRKVYFLLPRWNGAEGEFESFVDRTGNKMSGDKGDIFYARMVYHFFKRRIEGDAVFENTKLSWKRTKKGFELLQKQFPNSLDVQSGYANLATAAKDEEVAIAMFKKIGNRCNKNTWTRSEFIAARQKAASYKPKAKSPHAKNEDDEDAENEK